MTKFYYIKDFETKKYFKAGWTWDNPEHWEWTSVIWLGNDDYETPTRFKTLEDAEDTIKKLLEFNRLPFMNLYGDLLEIVCVYSQ